MSNGGCSIVATGDAKPAVSSEYRRKNVTAVLPLSPGNRAKERSLPSPPTAPVETDLRNSDSNYDQDESGDAVKNNNDDFPNSSNNNSSSSSSSSESENTAIDNGINKGDKSADAGKIVVDDGMRKSKIKIVSDIV